MKRRIISTGDGSKTIQIDDWDERYHSHHGAIQESQYVYIEKGLQHFLAENSNIQQPIKILEMGFGTGLNVLLSYQFSKKHQIPLELTTVEAFPISEEEYSLLDYADQLKIPKEIFNTLHEAKWEERFRLTGDFSVLKIKQTFQEVDFDGVFDIIYYDAFGSRVQPELWNRSIFEKMHKALKKGGVLVTYAAIGQVRRDMTSIGFEVERLDGPPNKRHMMRATKVD